MVGLIAELRRVRPPAGSAIDVSGVIWIRPSGHTLRWGEKAPTVSGHYHVRPIADRKRDDIVYVRAPLDPDLYRDCEWSDRPIPKPLEPDEVDESALARERLAIERAKRRDTTVIQEVERLA